MEKVEQLIGILKKVRGHSFYHFTDTRNLDSIREHGLLSMRELRHRGIIPITGGNEWSLDADARCGMDAYVHLCFLRQHGMEWRARQDGRIAQSRFLRISPEVLRLPGVLITDEVSNKAGVIPKPADEMIPKLDYEVMYTRTDWKNPAIRARRDKAKLYEILVPSNVPTDYILDL
jgi:ssDNA thymidine ADP-ribosyltransferase, DarT